VLCAAAHNTYVPTWEGWVYLATVIDCYSKKVIAYAMDDHYKTPLITTAIRRAAHNEHLAPGAILHTDRGSNYTSQEFAAVLADLDMRRSMGRPGSATTTQWQNRSSPR